MDVAEKAKRYDEAIKRAKEMYSKFEGMKQGDVLEDVFPELKESEDEKIRKKLIAYFVRYKEQAICGVKTFYGIPSDKILAWLEKQGEQKSVDGTFVNVDDVREDFVKEVYRVLDTDTNNDRANQIIEAFDNLPTVTIEKQGEQKPAWSEEDEYNYNTILHYLDLRKEKYKKECNQEEQDRYQGLYNWLKSLRPQNRWKPSDEQMAVLNEVIDYAANSELQHWSSFIYTLLKSLREQLKKLRGE